MKPCGPCDRLYIASFEPSRRSTDAVASINPSIGIRSGSLWPPTKLYLGNPGKRGAGSGNPLAKHVVRSNAALIVVSFRRAFPNPVIAGEARQSPAPRDKPLGNQPPRNHLTAVPGRGAGP